MNRRAQPSDSQGRAIKFKNTFRFRTTNIQRCAILLYVGLAPPKFYRREKQMHRIELGEILRDADVANAISTVVHDYRLTEDQTERALSELHVARAANVAGMTHQTLPWTSLLRTSQGQHSWELAG